MAGPHRPLEKSLFKHTDKLLRAPYFQISEGFAVAGDTGSEDGAGWPPAPGLGPRMPGA